MLIENKDGAVRLCSSVLQGVGTDSLKRGLVVTHAVRLLADRVGPGTSRPDAIHDNSSDWVNEWTGWKEKFPVSPSMIREQCDGPLCGREHESEVRRC
jgi:hypothetical protein